MLLFDGHPAPGSPAAGVKSSGLQHEVSRAVTQAVVIAVVVWPWVERLIYGYL